MLSKLMDSLEEERFRGQEQQELKFSGNFGRRNVELLRRNGSIDSHKKAPVKWTQNRQHDANEQRKNPRWIYG